MSDDTCVFSLVCIYIPSRELSRVHLPVGSCCFYPRLDDNGVACGKRIESTWTQLAAISRSSAECPACLARSLRLSRCRGTWSGGSSSASTYPGLSGSFRSCLRYRLPTHLLSAARHGYCLQPTAHCQWPQTSPRIAPPLHTAPPLIHCTRRPAVDAARAALLLCRLRTLRALAGDLACETLAGGRGPRGRPLSSPRGGGLASLWAGLSLQRSLELVAPHGTAAPPCGTSLPPPRPQPSALCRSFAAQHPAGADCVGRGAGPGDRARGGRGERALLVPRLRSQAARQHGQGGPPGQFPGRAVPERGPCASSGRAGQLCWAARLSKNRGRATERPATASCAQVKLAGSKVVDLTVLGHSGPRTCSRASRCTLRTCTPAPPRR